MPPVQAESVDQSSLFTLFEERSQRQPEAVCVQTKGESASFSEIRAHSAVVAARLKALGAHRETLVALCLNRSIELVVATLGVLESGAAFLPIDPQTPDERLRYMLRDSGASFVITDAAIAPRVTPTRVVLIESFGPANGPLETLPNHFDRAADDLAYVIYTSGSTGRPKGVEVCNRAFRLSVDAIRKELGVTAEDTVLQVTSQSFDVSILELFVSLTSGARLVIFPSGQMMQGEALREAIEANRVSVLFGTPTLWRLLLDSGWTGSSRLRAVIGGELLHADLARRLLPLAHSIWNHYGPTEAAVVSTTHQVRVTDNPVPIGRPLPHVRIEVVDRSDRPVGPGLAGELLIGGDSLARGYRNHPELTRVKFVRLETTPGRIERFYRTGDLVRTNGEGALDFIGRIDNQVKVRGFRVELEEIEAVLGEHADISRCAVVTYDDPQWGRSLIAYYRTHSGDSLPDQTLRSHLAAQLPVYMLPAQFIRLDRFPITVNGKIDRLNLSRRQLPVTAEPVTAPGLDPVTEELLKIWRRVLKHPSLGLDDNFFELGGHSITAARLFTEIKERLHRSLPLATLFEAPTVALLSQVINRTGERGWSPLVSIQTAGTGTPLFCVHPIGGNVLIFKQLGEYIQSRPFYGLQARGLNGQERPNRTIEAMAADYVRQVKQVQPSGPYLLGGYSAGGLVAFEMARLLKEDGDEVERVVLLDTYLHALSLPNVIQHKPTPLITKVLSAIRRRLSQMRNVSMDKRLDIIGRDLARIGATFKFTILDVCERFGYTPFHLDAVAGFLLALRTYRPKPLDVNVILFLADINAPPAAGTLPDVWSRLVARHLEVVHLHTNHDRLLEGENAELVARRIEASIAASRAVST